MVLDMGKERNILNSYSGNRPEPSSQYTYIHIYIYMVASLAPSDSHRAGTTSALYTQR